MLISEIAAFHFRGRPKAPQTSPRTNGLCSFDTGVKLQKSALLSRRVRKRKVLLTSGQMGLSGVGNERPLNTSSCADRPARTVEGHLTSVPARVGRWCHPCHPSDLQGQARGTGQASTALTRMPLGGFRCLQLPALLWGPVLQHARVPKGERPGVLLGSETGALGTERRTDAVRWFWATVHLSVQNCSAAKKFH